MNGMGIAMGHCDSVASSGSHNSNSSGSVESVESFESDHACVGFEDPLQLFTEAREIMERTGTLESAAGAKLMTSIGTLHFRRKDLDGALTVLERAGELYESTGTMHQGSAAFAMHALGDVQVEREMWPEAFAAYHLSRLIRQAHNTFGRRHGQQLLDSIKLMEMKLPPGSVSSLCAFVEGSFNGSLQVTGLTSFITRGIPVQRFSGCWHAETTLSKERFLSL